jgi:hypothetical protein
MQQVSENLLAILQTPSTTPKRWQMLVEIYHQDAEPGENGFDPESSDFMWGFAKVAEISFCTRDYDKLLLSIGDIKRTLRKELSTVSFSLSNSSREVVDFEYLHGFEGKICVIRLIDRTESVELSDSIVLFTGRCDKVDTFDKASEKCSISVKQILNQTELKIPRRKFTHDDLEGRVPSDALFEGFRFVQRSGSVQYQEKVKRGGLLGWLGFKKKVWRTLPYSSHSDVNSEKSVPLVLGRQQIELVNFAFEDKGTSIDIMAFACEGQIQGFQNVRSVTNGFPITILATKIGEPGGTGSQTNDAPTFVGAGIFSRLAYLRLNATGTQLEVDDPAPSVVAIILGLLVPMYDGSGDFTLEEWTDNGPILSRWVLNSEEFFNLGANWFEDLEIIASAAYCDQILVDQTNSETVLLSNSQNGIAGDAYKYYQSTAKINKDYWLKLSGAANYNSFVQEAPYNYYDDIPYNSDDWLGTGEPSLPPTVYRRRYTTNLVLQEQMSALDFLFDLLFTSFNGYLVQKANGKLSVRVAKPVDFSFVHTASEETDDEILVMSIEAWRISPGRILIGANLPTSEVRTVTDTKYSTIGNSIAISASGGVSASGATLSGGNDDTAPSATLTVSSASGTKTIEIDGFELVYVPASDTTVTVAAMLASMINSHNILTRYIKAEWTPNTSVVTVKSKIGALVLDAELENVHNAALANPAILPTLTAESGGSLSAGVYQVSYSYVTLEGETLSTAPQNVTLTANQKIDVSAITPPVRVIAVRWYVSLEANGVRRRLYLTNDGSGFEINSLPRADDAVEPIENLTGEEIHRIAMSFANRAETQAALTASNMLKGSFRFPMGSRQPSTNQIELTFIDSSQDFLQTKLRIKDKAHIAKVKKTNTKEINGTAIDSYHQARRIGNQKLAEWRDGDFFHGFTSDNEALLLEEGDVICVTDDAGNFINEPVRVEDLSISDDNGYPKISIIGKKYRRYYYDDQIQEKLVPLPIFSSPINLEQNVPVIRQNGSATNTQVTITIENFTDKARFRKIEMSENSDMSGATVSKVEASTTGVLASNETITKVSEVSAVTRYFRISHSSNDIQYGDPSNILTVTFADDGGSGGSGGSGSPPILDGYWDNLSEEVFLSWINQGGSGTFTLERRVIIFATPGWTEVSNSIGSSEIDFVENQYPSYYDKYVEYRIKRNDVEGWSNIVSVFIEGTGS